MPSFSTRHIEPLLPAAGTVYTKAGFATAGLVAAGPSESVFVEAGAGIAGTVGSGPSASVFQKSGFASAAGVGAGVSEHIVYVPYTASFELGVQGATVTTGDTGNATAWDAVLIATGGTVAYDDVHSAHRVNHLTKTGEV